MAVGAEMVKTLRERSGVGIMECKEALEATGGDIEAAADYLRKKGLSKAVKKADRTTSEGTVSSYIHPGGKIGVLLELNCETDFVARTDQFQSLAKDITMQIAAASPLYIKKEDIPPEVIAKERDIYITQAKESGKPEGVIQKITDGKMGKYYTEVCLIEQSFVKDQDITIRELIAKRIAELGENIKVNRFARFQLGK
ncbi:MAG: translation elongation factor Ts [Nitrospinae bacterium]|nr:translation elongation factor Ts [Nitrospinota bacterium]MBI3813680.1 translation elongation factor Ts [Nitrospinota bacterium]